MPSRAASFELGDARTQSFDFARFILLRHIMIIIVMGEGFIDVGAVGELVQDWFRVSQDPGERPKDSAENKRHQAKALDQTRLRMLPLMRDLFRQDVHEPKNSDSNDRRDNEHRP